MAEENAAMAILEALVAVHGADWLVDQVGDNLRGELALLGFLDEESTETTHDDAEEGAQEEADSESLASTDSAGEPMDEE